MNPNIIQIMDKADVLRGSRLVLSPGLRPMRIVLRDLGDKFVTHQEYMHVSVETKRWTYPDGIGPDREYDFVVCTNDGFEHGHYFEYKRGDELSKAAAYNEAIADYEERSRKV